MDLTRSILQDVRVALGLAIDSRDFDAELLPHINSSIGKLNQNGVGQFLIVTDDTSTWTDLMDPTQTDGNKYFKMIPLFVILSTKMLFDPPPPSTVQHYANNIEETLWRLKTAYEQPYVTPTSTEE